MIGKCSVTTELEPFFLELPSRGRLMGLDLGQRRIGVAVTDPGRMIASPLETWTRAPRNVLVGRLMQKLSSEETVGLVVGHPVHMSGRDSPQAQSARAFVRHCKSSLSIPALLWDERLSTAAVERVMVSGDLSRARRREVVDRASAAYILQGVIDALAKRSLYRQKELRDG